MRPLIASFLFAAVALGGTALAQPVLVLDPWASEQEGRQPNTWFPAEAPHVATLAEPEGESPVRVEPGTRGPERNTPLGTGESAAPFEPDAGGLVVDPWARSARKDAVARSSEPARRGAWSARVVEVVDPWKRSARFAGDTSLRLIVDPWAP